MVRTVRCKKLNVYGEEILVCNKKVYKLMSPDTYKLWEIDKLLKKR